ncbi:asparagine synthase-related protein [Wenzhouxiangella sp. EGI_FJ10305]|uniref:asparagine synthase-related protein n=1 Tax=Wenzhouxiangella sp. EGI_FJ10305 TaxID=3243768 RepID=UPI0035D9D630
MAAEQPGGINSGPYALVSDNGIECIDRRPGSSPDRPSTHYGWIAVDGWTHLSADLLAGAGATAAAAEKTPLRYIARLVQAHGPSILRAVGGGFVAVVVFPDSGLVQCYRSRNGSRTCYWAHAGESLAIASSAARIARLPAFCSDEDPEWISGFFSSQSGLLPGRSPFFGVNELLPAELLTARDSRIEHRRDPFYVAAPDPAEQIPSPSCANHPSQYAVDRFSATFRRAVQTTLPEMESPAIMLSGGLDSGPVAAVATELLSHSGRKPAVISWSLEEYPEADEWPWISMLARHLGLKTHRVRCGARLPFSDLTTRMIDKDFPNFNAFRPLVIECYARARDLGYTVVLNGAAGDRIYPEPRYRLYDTLARNGIAAGLKLAVEVAHRHGITGCHRAPEFRYLARRIVGRRVADRQQIPDWLTPEASASLRRPDPWPPEAGRHRIPEFAGSLLAPLTPGSLARENRFAQRYGIDRRDPFLDPELLRFMLALPHSMVYADGTTKWIMRESMRGRLPEQFRTKSRTGLLGSFYEAGYRANLPNIRALLLDHREWRKWVREDYLEKVLKQDSPESRDAMLVANCIGYTLWRQRLKE